MSDHFQNFNNLYGNLAQSTYPDNPNQFPIDKLASSKKSALNSSQSVPFDFSKNLDYDGTLIPGGKNLGDDAVVYLQPDPTHTATKMTTVTVPKANGGYEDRTYVSKRYKKGLLTDEDAGFNAYFLTSAPSLKDSKAAYLAVRGSDGEFDIKNPSNWNDWGGNDAPFFLKNAFIPQGKLAGQAMQTLVARLKSEAPVDTKLNMTGHSLGTMAIVQGMGSLSLEDLDRIGEVVLFNGPDVTDSLRKMGLSQEQINAISAKVKYYVNPFDMVSMLNRDKPLDQQLGEVNVIVPLRFTNSFDTPSAHMFGVYQIGPDGTPLVASADFHPELLVAGQRLAELVAEFRSSLPLSVAQIQEYKRRYQAIIDDAKIAAVKWNMENIPKYQELIRATTDAAERIRLRAELLQSSAQLALLQTEEQVNAVKKQVADAKAQVQAIIDVGRMQVYSMAQYSSSAEVEALLAGFQMGSVWDEGIEESTLREVDVYGEKISTFSDNLAKAAQQLEDVDKQGADFFK